MAELSKLGRYELRRILGKGAMGVVYEGYDPTLSRRVAVKTILKSVAFDDETERAYAERFVREAKAVARLNHANIVQVHDFGVENEVAYLVMEFIQGRELRSHFLAGERFEAAECVRIMGELLDALDFAHEAGVIHRDVKPANVMLDAQRRVKLADFGVARVQDSERSAAGTMVGTPAFMSPEQISGGKIDRRTDIFSAGTILYQLLTGEQPFKGDGAWTVAKQIMQDDPPHPSSVVQSVSPVFDGIVTKALAKKPNERYASAREFAAALRGTHAPGAQAPAVVTPKAKARAEPKASDTELEFWRAIQNRDDLDELELYVEQFPDGAYTQLASLKIAKLKEPAEAARKAAEEQARKAREAQEKARQEAQAAEKSRLEAQALARRQAEEKGRREAEEKVQREALDKARREAAEHAKRESEEKIRQAQVLARLKQQEEAAARAKAAADADATVAIGGGAQPAAVAGERKTFYAIPAVVATILIAGGVGSYMYMARKPAHAPVAEAPVAPQAALPAPAAPVKAELSAADVEKIRKETEERIRREYADKSAAEQAAAAKAAAVKAVQEKQQEMKAAAEKAAQEKQLATKLAAERAAAEKLAAERAAAERAARVAAEKAEEEKAAAARAAEKRAAAKTSPASAIGTAGSAAALREAGLAGRYAFRLAPGSGIQQACDRIGLQEDVEIPAGGSPNISGKAFTEFQIRSAQDGSIAATLRHGSAYGGGGDARLSGRANATGYAGTYDWRSGNVTCSGTWTLVRKGEGSAEMAAASAKSPPASVAAAPSRPELPGRFAFRLMTGSGVHQTCDSIGFQEDIVIPAGGSQGITGKGFANLQFQSVQDGSITATAQGVWSRWGTGEVILTGRSTAIGYAGAYSWRVTGNISCAGQWTLVRK